MKDHTLENIAYYFIFIHLKDQCKMIVKTGPVLLAENIVGRDPSCLLVVLYDLATTHRPQ